MTKTEALNKSAQEAGFPKFDKTLFKHFEKNEVELENIIRRAMDIYVNEQYNQAIRDADEHIISRLKPIINAQFIYDSIKITKLLK